MHPVELGARKFVDGQSRSANLDMGLSGKTALVTGGGRGLGAAIAKSLARERVRILLVSRGAESLEKTLSELPGDLEHAGISVDLSQPSALGLVVEWVDGLGAEIDVIINNVGGTLDVNEPLASWSQFQRVLDLNLGVAVEVNRLFIPGMRERGWGRICHVSSISALENQGPPSYCAAKAGLNAYIRSVGRYVAPDNVILTGIMPGAVFTEGGYWDIALRERPEHVQRYLSDRMAIGRFGTEGEIAEATTFLVSEQASFLVGSVLLADGGQGRVFQAGLS